MQIARRHALLGGAASAALSTLASPANAILKPLQVGFYNGNGADGVNGMNTRFKPWLGRTPDLAVDFVNFSSWANFRSDALWAIGFWKGIVPKLCLTVGLTVSGTPLSEVAAGLHDASFDAAAAEMVRQGFQKSIIRLGHEANGGWYPWGNLGTDPSMWKLYIQCFQRVRNIFALRSAYFKFDWCMAAGWQQTGDKSVLYPGDAYVDYIGMDIEPQVWGVTDPTTQQCWDALQQGWSLDWLPGFTRAHRKKISFPEFGIGDAAQGHPNYGPGDNGQLATMLMQWAKQNQVSYIGFWDFNAGDYNSQFSDSSRPNCAAAFKAGIW